MVRRNLSFGSQKRNSTVSQTLTSTQSYASSNPMAGSVLRSKMRSLRQGKAEEVKGQTAQWAVWRSSWRSHMTGKVRVKDKNVFYVGRTAPYYQFHMCMIAHVTDKREKETKFSFSLLNLSSFLCVVRRFLHRKLHGHAAFARIRLGRCPRFAYG